MENIIFENCGATLSSDALQSVNSSDLYYSPHHAAVLLFNHCWNITLTNVAILASDIHVFGMSAFESLFVTNAAFLSSMAPTDKDLPTIGSGMLIHYVDSEHQSTEGQHEVIVSHSMFSDNVNHVENCQVYPYIYHDSNQPLSITNAAAFTSFYMYTQNTFKANVSVTNKFFGHNLGEAILLLHINSYNDSQTFMEGNFLTQNCISVKCHGTAVSMYTHFKPAQQSTNNDGGQYQYQYRLTIVNTLFHNHTTVTYNCSNEESQGVLYFGTDNDNKMSQTVILLHNVTFQKNVAQYSGTAVYAKSYGQAYTMEIFMSSITAQMNSIYCLITRKYQTEIFQLNQINFVYIIGTNDFPSTFTNNTESVIIATGSNIYLFGHLQFMGNYGNNGAAISLYKESCLHFAQGASILFEDNIAQLSGGATYTSTSGEQCPIQPYPFPVNHAHTSSYTCTNITFNNNQATCCIFIHRVNKCTRSTRMYLYTKHREVRGV